MTSEGSRERFEGDYADKYAETERRVKCAQIRKYGPPLAYVEIDFISYNVLSLQTVFFATRMTHGLNYIICTN